MTAYLADTPVLETERLTLRAPVISDYPACSAFICSERAAFVRAEPGTPRLAWRVLSNMTGMWALRGYGLFVFCDRHSGAALGAAGPWHPIDWPELEIGWSVWAEEAEGKGIAAEAAEAVRDYIYGPLGSTTAVSYIDPANTRSIALAERISCTVDNAAPQPDFGQQGPVLVYRHPAPEALQ
ncbi:MAG: GNAT family N-acetyltransferase [Roseobacter sp.]|jgi:RimJ/RimL family protein N-acetyltransferase|nr:GNAT family N-acetyltransferase [Roseobacter sp.]